MIESVGVLRQVKLERRLVKLTIVNAGQVPGGIVDGKSIAADGRIEDFEDLTKEPDGAVLVDPTTTLHHEKRFDIGNLGHGLTYRSPGQTLFQRRAAQRPVAALVILFEPFVKGRVDLFEGFGGIYRQKLIPDGPKKSFYFSASLRSIRRGVDHLHSQTGTNDLQVTAGVAGSVVGIKPFRDTKPPYGGHQVADEAFDFLRQIEAAADHITGTVVQDDMQVGFSFVSALFDLRSVKKVRHPQLTKGIKGK